MSTERLIKHQEKGEGTYTYSCTCTCMLDLSLSLLKWISYHETTIYKRNCAKLDFLVNFLSLCTQNQNTAISVLELHISLVIALVLALVCDYINMSTGLLQHI